MKIPALITFLFLTFSNAFAGEPIPLMLYNWNIVKVIDGDTVKFEAPFLPDPLKKTLNLRINGIDTPEKGRRAQCAYEDLMSRKATAFTKEFLSTGEVYIVLEKWGKFGGRVLGDIIIDDERLSLALIDAGLARAYDGGKKESWCEND